MMSTFNEVICENLILWRIRVNKEIKFIQLEGLNPMDIWMKRTRVHTQYFTRLLQPLVFFLSLSHSPLSSLSHPLSPLLTLLALLSFPKCFYRSIFTEVFSQSSLYSSFSRNVTSPKQSHRNQITEIWMSIFIRKKFAGCWSWTRVSSVHKRVCYPFGYVESTKYEAKNVLFVQKR
jgi:hypothetical protein